MKNTLYLLLPIITSNDTYEDEHVYLKSLDRDPRDFLKETFETFLHLYTHEDFTTYYDQRRLAALLKAAKVANGGQYTEAHKLLNTLAKREFNDYSPKCKNTNTISVNDVPVAHGILNAYIELSTQYDTLVNPLSLQCEPIYLRILDNNAIEHQVSCIHCDRLSLHTWFVTNRTPKRVLDTNYDKHHNEEREGKHGVISALTYNTTEIESLMHQAIKHAKNLYLKDNRKEKLIIFWSENLEMPTYHAYEVSIDNKAEIDKIYKKGHRELYHLIDTYSIDA